MLEFKFQIFPAIETERLLLRQISMEDAEDFLILRSNVDAMKHLGKSLPKSISEIHSLIDRMEKSYYNHDSIAWGICLKSSNTVIGTIGYHRIDKEHHRAEIGYMILPEHWKKGFTSEAMAPVLDYGFNKLHLHSVEAKIDPANKASSALLKKFKFDPEAFYKQNYYFNGNFLDTEVYSLLKEKYLTAG